jgi:SEC-C motif domain protein
MHIHLQVACIGYGVNKYIYVYIISSLFCWRNEMFLCPCQSGQPYQICCSPLHQGVVLVQSPEQLMRSRYSAYALGHIDYIVHTTVLVQQPLLDQRGIRAWSQNSQWLGLTVYEQKIARHSVHHAWVRFTAKWQDQQGLHQHDELSAFVQVGQQWFFIDPNHPYRVGQNDCCLCGRQVKFKKCCAPMIQ